jgi:3-hydroxy acid dehydrogenase / malonic semialdehyde reductase
MTDLKGKIVLITGASSGIGEACARAFAAEGADLILTARSLPKLEALATELSEAHVVRVLPLMLDVRHRIAVERTLGSLTTDWSDISILVNNAGLVRGMDKLFEGNPDEWDEMVDTNVKGLLLVTRAVVPGMIARGRGHVINIGSIAGRETYPGGGVYCATKYAVKALTRALRMDLLGTPIRVTTVDPGMVETNFSVVRFRGDKERAAKVYENLEPLRPEDIAESVCWAATRPARVNVSEMVVLPTAQASAMLNHRGPWKKGE